MLNTGITMKKTLITLLVTVSLGMTGCQDTFLQMPDTTGTVDLNEVYGSAKNAKSALMTCYREILLHGLPGGWGVSHGTLGAISGEVARGYSWHGTYMIVNSGLNVNGTDGSDAGADHFGNNWAYIRHCWTVYENIDRVPDMTPEEKNYVKAEASGSLNLPEGLESYWNAVTYTSYWNPRMYLEPLPQSEINKGTLVQNPGY